MQKSILRQKTQQEKEKKQQKKGKARKGT